MRIGAVLMVVILFLHACSPADPLVVPGYIGNLVVGEPTTFDFNGSRCEIDGVFNHEYTDDPMWTLRYADIDAMEGIMKASLASGRVKQGHIYADAGGPVIGEVLVDLDSRVIEVSVP